MLPGSWLCPSACLKPSNSHNAPHEVWTGTVPTSQMGKLRHEMPSHMLWSSAFGVRARVGLGQFGLRLFYLNPNIMPLG